MNEEMTKSMECVLANALKIIQEGAMTGWDIKRIRDEMIFWFDPVDYFEHLGAETGAVLSAIYDAWLNGIIEGMKIGKE